MDDPEKPSEVPNPIRTETLRYLSPAEAKACFSVNDLTVGFRAYQQPWMSTL